MFTTTYILTIAATFVFVCQLETDKDILVTKATDAMNKYRMDAVVANLLSDLEVVHVYSPTSTVRLFLVVFGAALDFRDHNVMLVNGPGRDDTDALTDKVG